MALQADLERVREIFVNMLGMPIVKNMIKNIEMDLIDPSIPYQLAQNSRFGYYQGSYNGMAKLTENDVIYIRSNYIPKGKGQKCNRQELAAYFGVSVGLISRIVKNEIWTHI